MTSKYNNYATESLMEADGGDPALTSQKKNKKGNVTSGKQSPQRRNAKDTPDASNTNDGVDFSRLQAHNMTGFTQDSVETGIKSKQTPLAHRKASMFPDISAVEQFYEKN